MNTIKLKPKNRSKLRVFLGSKYYRLVRYFKWVFDDNIYTTKLIKEKFKHRIFEHSTPIYRKLKDVDRLLQENKANNLRIAIKRIDKIVIGPQETFSYWKLIGNPTRSKGYKKGMVLYYGQFKGGVGGGLCQLSNMIFWMAIHSPLSVVERYRHSYDVFPDSNRTQPFGSGATCVYNYRDLVIKNETNESYQINLSIEDGYLKGEILSDVDKYFDYEVYEASHEITHEYWGAYIRHNEIRRKVRNIQGNEIADDYICENHALMMYEPFLEYKSHGCNP